jgi:Tfp pilus assembly protein PilN
MKVRLNLATSPLENNRRFLLGSALLGAVALAALAMLSTSAYGNWNANRNVRSEMADLNRKMRDFRGERKELEDFFKQPDTMKIMDRAAFLNALIEQRSFPWTKMFTDLERMIPLGVRVVSISPRMTGGRVEVRLNIGAQTDEGKLQLIEALEKSTEFERIQVLSETRPTRPEENDRVLLELVAFYTATELPAPEEKPAKPKPTNKSSPAK